MSTATQSNMFLASYIEKRFGLSAGYFKRAKRQNTKLELKIIEQYESLFVLLSDETTDLIKCGYISLKINQDDCVDLFDYIYTMTKSTHIGFYRDNPKELK